jgi:hypothetical protein
VSCRSALEVTTKAIRIHEYGDAGTLKLEEVPPPYSPQATIPKGEIYESWKLDDDNIAPRALYHRPVHNAGSTKSVGPEVEGPYIRAGL